VKLCKLGAPERNSYSAEIKINGDNQYGRNHLGRIGFKVKSKPLGNWIGERRVYLDATISSRSILMMLATTQLVCSLSRLMSLPNWFDRCRSKQHRKDATTWP
jgi:hypothetical protein